MFLVLTALSASAADWSVTVRFTSGKTGGPTEKVQVVHRSSGCRVIARRIFQDKAHKPLLSDETVDCSVVAPLQESVKALHGWEPQEAGPIPIHFGSRGLDTTWGDEAKGVGWSRPIGNGAKVEELTRALGAIAKAHAKIELYYLTG